MTRVRGLKSNDIIVDYEQEWSPELLYCAGFLPCNHPKYEQIASSFAKAEEELRQRKLNANKTN